MGGLARRDLGGAGRRDCDWERKVGWGAWMTTATGLAKKVARGQRLTRKRPGRVRDVGAKLAQSWAGLAATALSLPPLSKVSLSSSVWILFSFIYFIIIILN